MIELSGTLSGTALVALLTFLWNLRATGRLAIVIEPIMGTVFLERGRVVGAVLQSESGIDALDALALIPGFARFGFAESHGEPLRNIAAEPSQLQEHLEHLVLDGRRLAAAVPSLTTVPRVASEDETASDPIVLPRSTLGLLLELREQKDVLALTRSFGLREALHGLSQLVAMGLVVAAPEHVSQAGSAPFARSRIFLPRSGNREPQPSGKPGSHSVQESTSAFSGRNN